MPSDQQHGSETGWFYQTHVEDRFVTQSALDLALAIFQQQASCGVQEAPTVLVQNVHTSPTGQ
eukprot:11442452-Karenia_brevis.AAC.1